MGKEKKEPSFEEALEQLENLVNSMEDGDIPLTDLVEKFEEGTKLLKSCEKSLKKAELKIEKLKDSGSLESESFDPSADN